MRRGSFGKGPQKHEPAGILLNGIRDCGVLWPEMAAAFAAGDGDVDALAWETGSFVYAAEAEGAVEAVHELRWDPAPRRTAQSGIIGFAARLQSWPRDAAWLAGPCRVHVCRHCPCTAMFAAGKYGPKLPPPFRHGRLLRIGRGEGPLRLEDVWARVAGASPTAALPPPPLPPPAEEPQAAAVPLSPAPPSAAPPLPVPAPPVQSPGTAASAPLTAGAPAEVAAAAVTDAPESAEAGANAPATAGRAQETSAAAAPAPQDQPPPASAPAAPETQPQPALSEGSAISLAASSSDRPPRDASRIAEGAPPLTPAQVAALRAERADLAGRILRRAEEAARAGAYIGLFEFCAFAVSRKRRLYVRMREGTLDVAAEFVPAAMDASWNMAPFSVQVAAVRWDDVGFWAMADFTNTSHYVALVPAGRTVACDGRSAAAVSMRAGFNLVHTVADGNCGIDALNIVEGVGRTVVEQHRLRAQLRSFMVRVAGRALWQSLFAALCEAESPAAQARGSSVNKPAPPAKGSSGQAPAPSEGPSPAGALPASSAAPAAAGTAPAVEAEPPADANQAQAAPVTAAAGRSAKAPATAGTAPAVKAEPPADANQARPAEEPDVGAGAAESGLVPLGGSAQELDSAVRSAVMWGTGLPRPSEWMLRRLASGMSEEELGKLVQAHQAALAEPPRPPSGPGPLALARRNAAGRKNARTLVTQRLNDARLFAAWAASEGFDYRHPCPRGKMQAFFEYLQCPPMSSGERNRSSMYLRRAVQLLVSGASPHPCLRGVRRADGRGGGTRWARRSRKVGAQGRPKKAALLGDMLFQWFSVIKHSVKGRISPGLVLKKARLLQQTRIAASLRNAVPAASSVIDYKWLQRWRYDHGVSLRCPNRKWKVAAEVLKERLQMTWLNVIRVRKLAAMVLGRDLAMDNFDQSPFHMNEAGSKNSKTLGIRGGGVVPIKEGHAATRERWTANTMTTSCLERARAIPPLELMFRCESGGQYLHPRLRGMIPPWAPWLTVVTSLSGSYDEDHVLTYMETVLEPMAPGRDWRILLVDCFAPQMTDAVRRLAWHRGYVLCIHGGGATSVCQPNDTDLHAHLKRAYIELETEDALEQQQLRPRGVPVPRKEDAMGWMASLWARPGLHEAAAAGFKKVGLANALDGSEDHLICREAKTFWEELRMRERRRDALGDVEMEVQAGRLRWTYEDIGKIVLPMPKRGARADFQPDDEGSASGDGGSAASEPPSDGEDGGSDGGGGGGGGSPREVGASAPVTAGDAGNEAPATAGTAGTSSDKQPVDAERAAVCSPQAPATAGESSAMVVAMSPGEGDLMNEHRVRMDTLTAMRDQATAIGHDALLYTVQMAIGHEDWRRRGLQRENPAVAAALQHERDVETARARSSTLAAAEADRAHKRQRATIQQLRAEQAKLSKQQLDLHRASTAAECREALKSFDDCDLGQGHPTGGTAAHAKNRLSVLDRIRLRGKPLPPEQANDWEWFCRHWDKKRLGKIHPAFKASWGTQFKNIAKGLIDRIASGEGDAFSKWMASESRVHLSMPALRI